MNFQKLYEQLSGWVPSLPITVARELINSALKDIYDEHDWGFLYQKAVIRTSNLITASAEVTKYSKTVTLDATAKNAINALEVGDWDILERQFRSLTTNLSTPSMWYGIESYDSATGILTLKEEYQDSSSSSARIQIAKVYFNPPLINGDSEYDFRRFEHVITPLYQRYLFLNTTLTELNAFDPQRLRTDEPRYIIPIQPDSNGIPQFEFYPCPVREQALIVTYLREGKYFQTEEEELPRGLDRDLLITKAKIKGFEWAVAFSEVHENLKSPSRFMNLIAFNSKRYDELLEKAVKRDEELFPKSYLLPYGKCSYYEDLMENGMMGETLVLDFSPE